MIGATDKRGEDVTDGLAGPQEFLATIYRHLGIDYSQVLISDQLGRPVRIVSSAAQAIPQLAWVS